MVSGWLYWSIDIAMENVMKTGQLSANSHLLGYIETSSNAYSIEDAIKNQHHRHKVPLPKVEFNIWSQFI